MKFFAGDAAAAITGLQPVTGATVELIRIDNDGNQVGDVLAEAVTTIDGNYTLTLPAGVNLAGDLVVRITGASNSEMRAQVVQQAVNISPVSEFILRKFIENDTDLKVLDTSAVVKLSGHVQEFDLTVGSDLSAVFEQLEAAVGEFIEGQIDVIQLQPNDATGLVGDYRSASLQLALHDSNAQNFGSFAVDMWRSTFTFDGKADGSVDVHHSGEETAWGNMFGNDVGGTQLNYWADMDEESDTYAANYRSGVLFVEGEFDEEIEDDFAWRWPPVTYRLQKVKDQNLFFQLNQEASVRYATLDTDDDGIKDALNPAAPEGDEINRGIEVFYKTPTAMTTASVNGAYGRVYLGVLMYSSGHLELEVEANELTFDNGTLNYGAAQRNRISRNSVGENEAHVEPTEEEILSIEVAEDGQISVEGEHIDGYFNETADFAVMAEASGEDGEEANFSKTFFVKLPNSAPVMANKRYRIMFLDAHFKGREFHLRNTRFDSFVTFNSNTAGNALLGGTTLEKGSLGGNVVSGIIPVGERNVTAQIGSNGATTLQITDDGGVLHLQGYWNATASYGLFTTGFIATGETVPKSAGLAVLVEVSDGQPE